MSRRVIRYVVPVREPKPDANGICVGGEVYRAYEQLNKVHRVIVLFKILGTVRSVLFSPSEQLFRILGDIEVPEEVVDIDSWIQSLIKNPLDEIL